MTLDRDDKIIIAGFILFLVFYSTYQLEYMDSGCIIECPPCPVSVVSNNFKRFGMSARKGNITKPFIPGEIFEPYTTTCFSESIDVNKWVGWSLYTVFVGDVFGPDIKIPAASPYNVLDCIFVESDGTILLPKLPIYGPFGYPNCTK